MKRVDFFSILITIAFFSGFQNSLAQTEKEKSAMKLDLAYRQVNDGAPILNVTAKTKKGRKFEPVEGVEVTLSLMEAAPDNLLGKATTNVKGTASIQVPSEIAAKLDSLSPFKLIASVQSSDRFDETTTEIEITKARIELSLQAVDSTRNVAVKVLELKDGEWIEAPGTEVKIFVKRLFSDLPVGEDAYTTDKSGGVSVEFNIGIPGDAGGNILVGAKIDDSETYGTISSMKKINWGTAAKEDHSFSKRTLWAARDKTPLWLLIGPNLIIVTVWGIIFYLFYLIVRIRKIGMSKGNV